jgi:hypothetical protein
MFKHQLTLNQEPKWDGSDTNRWSCESRCLLGRSILNVNGRDDVCGSMVKFSHREGDWEEILRLRRMWWRRWRTVLQLRDARYRCVDALRYRGRPLKQSPERLIRSHSTSFHIAPLSNVSFIMAWIPWIDFVAYRTWLWASQLRLPTLADALSASARAPGRNDSQRNIFNVLLLSFLL